MEWIEISVAVKRVVIDEVTTLFDNFSSNGIIEEDLPDQPDLVKLTIYGDMSKPAQQWADEVEALLKEGHVDYSDLETKTVTDTDWYNSWQQYIEPTEILPHIIIRPAWKEYTPAAGDKIITIDSELSFGTGAHETTRACAELMATYGKGRKTCLDIGTGTGILLLVAYELGLTNLVGIDIDADAVAQAEANCKLNNVNATLICGDLDKDFDGKADLILANLTVDPLKMLLPAISKKLDANGILIISGIIDERYEEIMPFIQAHWKIETELVKGSWHTLALTPRVE
ncbi:MAG: 50S ribosomal protein L11 methyltransferase [Veillonella sp.]|uniref:50S ribosomal protein L11 methyltransferase n=1 Tax=Veillonella sp. TaxID=1926307 RepID=UPI0025D0AA16|nr:50S ribosomal protein L11 methyltransferase [Veillonella sp.]MBS4912804.1 50S ribosomal protein L11 methyltransferase [Veillonella sp.]